VLVVVIPGIFSPCKYKNTELIDGGIRENVPWKIIKQMGADYLLKIKTPDVSLLDVDEIDNLYHLGYVQAKEKINEIKKILY